MIVYLLFDGDGRLFDVYETEEAAERDRKHYEMVSNGSIVEAKVKS